MWPFRWAEPQRKHRCEWQDEPFGAIEREAERILAARPNLICIESEAWHGRTLAMENPGLCTLAFRTEWHTYDLAVSFFSPFHLNPVRTSVLWPHCDDPFHCFALWQVLQARSQPYEHLAHRVKSWNVPDVAAYTKAAVDEILATCLPILDGDLSITAEIVLLRHPLSTSKVFP